MSFTIQYIFSLIDRFTGPATALAAAAGRMKTSIAAAGAAMTPLISRIAALGAAVAVVGGIFMLRGVKSAAAFEDAMANVRRVTDISREDMLKYGKDALRVGVMTGQSGKEIATIMTQGALMGIRGQEPLRQFAELVSQVAVAWDDISTEMAAGQLARLSSKFFSDLAPEEATQRLRETADAINELSNRSAFKAPELLKFFDNASADAKRFGLTPEQTAAFGGAALVLDQPSGLRQGYRFGSGVSRLMSSLTTPTKTQREGWGRMRKLGLSPEAFGKIHARDPQEALLTFMETAAKAPKTQQRGILNQVLGHMDAGRQFAAVLSNTNEYKRMLAINDDKWAGKLAKDDTFMAWLMSGDEGRKELAKQLRELGKIGTRTDSVKREFQKRTETLTFATRQLNLALERLSIITAMPLLEPLRYAANGLTGVVSAMSDLAEHSGLAGATARTGMVAGVTALGAAAGMYVAKLLKFTEAAKTLSWVAKTAGRATFWLSVVTIGLAAAQWIYDNWGRLKNFAADPLNFKVHFPDAPPWLIRWLDFMENAKAQNKAGEEFRNWWNTGEVPADLQAAKAEQRKSLFGWLTGGFGPDDAWYDQQFANIRQLKTGLPALPPAQPPAPDRNPARAAAERIKIESSVRTQVDPVTFSPAQITVSGTINGAVTGSGSLQANPSRGTSTVEAGGSTGPGYNVAP